MLRFLFVLLLCFHGTGFAQTKYPATPDRLYGQLFTDVQLGRIFPDSKTFVDCIPLQSPAEIVAQYEKEKHQPRFDLKKFVLQHFQASASAKAVFFRNKRYTETYCGTVECFKAICRYGKRRKFFTAIAISIYRSGRKIQGSVLLGFLFHHAWVERKR
jgi:hypothetical protein